MAEPQPLSDEARRFIESIGVYFEQYDLPRICGRILGLLIVASRPLSLDDMAATLRVSRASVSTNVRLAVSTGLAELVGLLGQRRDHYRFTENPWEHAILVNIEGTQALKSIAARAIDGIAVEHVVAGTRLAELIEFCDFFIEEQHATLERWRQRHAAREAAREGATWPPFSQPQN
ncbi:MAG: transcriptional regulator [Ktedonobacterales bacterium]|nr:transcriptional regulator [Ktedonobacterales bacterium]